MTVVGVDISSKRIDLAWLEDGKPQRWHQELAKGHLIDRLRSIDIRWPVIGPRWYRNKDYDLVPQTHGLDVTDIAIEYPFGRGNAIAALMATTGVITRQAPPWARVAWPSSGELRAAIGAKNTKLSAHWAVGELMLDAGDGLQGWDEHELDALVAAIGWGQILAAQDAA